MGNHQNLIYLVSFLAAAVGEKPTDDLKKSTDDIFHQLRSPASEQNAAVAINTLPSSNKLDKYLETNEPNQISLETIEQQHFQHKQIFINQSNNIFILAKHGQTVSLPCIIFREKNHDLSNVSKNFTFFLLSFIGEITY